MSEFTAIFRPKATAMFLIVSLICFLDSSDTVLRAQGTKGANRPIPPLERIAAEHRLSADDLNVFIEKQVEFVLQNGKIVSNVTLKELVPAKDPNWIKVFVYSEEGEKKEKRLPVKQVHRIKVDGRELGVTFLATQNAAAIQDLDAKLTQVKSQLQLPFAVWDIYSDEQQRVHIEDHKAYLKRVTEFFSNLPLHLTETKYFLFLTDMPLNQVGPYIAHLDKMNEMLGNAFGFPAGHNVWKGKCVVIAFAQRASFLAFEQQFMNNTNAADAAGLCHSDTTGQVIISCYRGDDAARFGAVLVHETSHGYVHRYYTSKFAPTWVNEGMAEWIAQKVVPQSDSFRLRLAEAKQRLSQTGSLGGLFEATSIDGWQYGVSMGLVDFMIRQNPDQFRHFFNGIKEGLPWEDSLQRSYGWTPAELMILYGRSIGFPQLTP
ncbi:hypothetical protein SH668x_000438 [Planctomicrobium sp. SH668]|uniref:hypothetical protein n=1 Tax=Planctomicrobium sp. SH668 TaxID=3448126 RepID=UPI003F5B0855